MNAMVKSCIHLFCLLLAIPAFPQTVIATFEVSSASPLPTAAHVNLDAITALPEHALYIVEKGTAPERCCAFQVLKQDHRELHWIVPPGNKTRTYQLLSGRKPEINSPGLTLVKDDR